MPPLLQVNGTSLLGLTHQEAARAMKNIDNELRLLVCDGYDAAAVTSAAAGAAALTNAKADRSASVSSIDKETEESRIAQKVSQSVLVLVMWARQACWSSSHGRKVC